MVVVLTDGEANLAHFMDLLRDRGYRVLATARPYEAVLFVARNEVDTVLVRASLLPASTEEFLSKLREFKPAPFVVVAGAAEAVPADDSPLVDLWLTEPYRFSALLEAMEYGQEREVSTPKASASTTPGEPSVDSSGGVTKGRLLTAAPRLIACSRLLSELERDRDRLLSNALEMFLELAGAERGSIMLKSPKGDALEPKQIQVLRDWIRVDTPWPVPPPIEPLNSRLGRRISSSFVGFISIPTACSHPVTSLKPSRRTRTQRNGLN